MAEMNKYLLFADDGDEILSVDRFVGSFPTQEEAMEFFAGEYPEDYRGEAQIMEYNGVSFKCVRDWGWHQGGRVYKWYGEDG